MVEQEPYSRQLRELKATKKTAETFMKVRCQVELLCRIQGEVHVDFDSLQEATFAQRFEEIKERFRIDCTASFLFPQQN